MPSSICGLLAVVFLAASCASVGEKTKFYTLSVPSDTRGKDPYPGYSVTPIFIEVMPVSVPERLARPQLVVSSKGQDGELLVLEQARWSSPFNLELRDALAAAIAGKIGAIKVIRRGRLAGQPIYRIAIELSQFDATVGGRVNARFDWAITHSTQARSAACYSVISESAGDSIESLVKGIQHVVAAAAESISENLMQLNGGGAASCGFTEN
jgi:uncharacterized lipoprotein YmbA